jgi:ZIP family zinc transporter
VPHEHFLAGREGPDTETLSRIWLFVLAIAIHNVPEGMAVGVGFAGGDINNGISLATGIGVQNVPEGLAVAVALVAVGYSRMVAFLVAFLTGLAEPIGGLFGSAAAALAAPLLPWTLGFAAGAMLFIISDEIIPETHRGKFPDLSTFALLGGFALMMYLDATLG